MRSAEQQFKDNCCCHAHASRTVARGASRSIALLSLIAHKYECIKKGKEEELSHDFSPCKHPPLTHAFEWIKREKDKGLHEPLRVQVGSEVARMRGPPVSLNRTTREMIRAEAIDAGAD